MLFTALLKDPESSGVAVYYLAAIAERRGETATALRGYQMLGGTGARRRRPQSRRDHSL